MAGLGSAALPGLQDDDHIRGEPQAPLLIEYGDLECPYCAALHAKVLPLVRSGAVRLVYRHFPLRSAHPRAWQAACAAEAASLQGHFWEMHDALLADQGRLEDPHLWARATALDLDLDRFESDRRSDLVTARVKRDFSAGVRAGVVTAPTVFHDAVAHHGDSIDPLMLALGRPDR